MQVEEGKAAYSAALPEQKAFFKIPARFGHVPVAEEPLFITRNGKVAAVLQAANDDEIEDYLLRNSPRFWRLIESRRTQAKKGPTLPFDASSYGSDEPRGAKDRIVRENAAGYKTREKKRA